MATAQSPHSRRWIVFTMTYRCSTKVGRSPSCNVFETRNFFGFAEYHGVAWPKPPIIGLLDMWCTAKTIVSG